MSVSRKPEICSLSNSNFRFFNIFLENSDDKALKTKNDCNRKCNDSLNCAGYLFYPNNDGFDSVKCKLLNNNIYRKGIRVIDNNTEYNIRNKKVSNSNEGCNTKYTKNILFHYKGLIKKSLNTVHRAMATAQYPLRSNVF